MDLTPGDGWVYPILTVQIISTHRLPYLRIRLEGVFIQDINRDTLSASRGESYRDFDSFFAVEGTVNRYIKPRGSFSEPRGQCPFD